MLLLQHLRTIFALAAALGLALTGADIKTAYLYGFIEEDIDIYMVQPKGFEKKTKDGEPMVCKLIRSIYGLRQSGARWEARLVKELQGLGFQRCEWDPCLYKIAQGGDYLFLCVYVDDLIFAASSKEYREHIFNKICNVFNRNT